MRRKVGQGHGGQPQSGKKLAALLLQASELEGDSLFLPHDTVQSHQVIAAHGLVFLPRKGGEAVQLLLQHLQKGDIFFKLVFHTRLLLTGSYSPAM